LLLYVQHRSFTLFSHQFITFPQLSQIGEKVTPSVHLLRKPFWIMNFAFHLGNITESLFWKFKQISISSLNRVIFVGIKNILFIILLILLCKAEIDYTDWVTFAKNEQIDFYKLKILQLQRTIKEPIYLIIFLAYTRHK